MDKTELLAEAMRLIDEHTKACWANNFAAAACTQESIGTFLRANLAGQAEPKCGMSWSGFNIYGDEKSIREVRNAVHAAGTVPELKQRIRDLQDAAPAEPIAQEKTAYNMGRIAAWQEIRAAQPEQDQAQLVAALEEIASMTYDSWTNGARAGEIARVALKKAKDGQDSYRIDYGDYGSL